MTVPDLRVVVPRRCEWKEPIAPATAMVPVTAADVERSRYTRCLRPMRNTLCAMIGRGGEGRILAPWATGLTLRASPGKLDNQDGILALVGFPTALHEAPIRVAAVMDGLSNPEGGASAASVLQQRMAHDIDASYDGTQHVARVVGEAERAIHWTYDALNTASLDPPGTTVATAVLQGGTWALLTVGDSPAVVFRPVGSNPLGASLFCSTLQNWLLRKQPHLSEAEQLARRNEPDAYTMYSSVGGGGALIVQIDWGTFGIDGGTVVLSTDGYLSGNAGRGNLQRMVPAGEMLQWTHIAGAIFPIVDAMQLWRNVVCQPEVGDASTDTVMRDNIGVLFAEAPSLLDLHRVAATAHQTIAAYRPRNPAVARMWSAALAKVPQLHPERVVALAHLLHSGVCGLDLEPYLRIMRLL